MATFLELVQDTARESGTIPDLNAPSTVHGQSGRIARFPFWVRDAYKWIQVQREDWRWLRRLASNGPILPGVTSYDPESLGVTRFSGWLNNLDGEVGGFWIRRADESPDKERRMMLLPAERFTQNFRRGDAQGQDPGLPTYISVGPRDELLIFPSPDAEYILRGGYQASPQILSEDGDVPEMPAMHHDAIRLKALMLMATFDEASEGQMGSWAMDLRTHMAALERKQLPRISLAGPLA